MFQLALDIENETHEHNRLLDNIDGDFNSGETLLGGSLNRIKGLLTSGRQNRKIMCYMSAFVILFLFLVFYLLGKVTS